ncbi:M12 family metallopeptidase [Methylobacterium soli]|uniref:Peptidase metallopeptidase domain-containing protein n=1 Tax=Methylobacterium soli TaxID=553447 RepID=A0A6L3SQU3_9HYPH|nr:M12 family metallopeptidase [Methylobacterium soli]KAB1070132.1 hypothetical protein F6X53_30455 [Methylobacterium soli]GJE44317.1 hypothetical protein AEGHOMDF_3505 [Methylobacterium soli]
MKCIPFLATLLLAFSSSASTAHDLWGIANPALHDPEIMVANDLASAANSQPATSKERYILERALLWRPGAALRACFLNGSSSDQDAVASAIDALNLSANKVNLTVNFVGDCSSSGAPEIRISFQDGCCFAYVGRTALHSQLRGRPTVYLQPGLPKYIIQHEILHAFGVHHEHQNPDGANCYDNLINVASYASSNGWNVTTVEDNLRVLGRNQRKFLFSTDRDEKSITHYHIPAEHLKGGKSDPCFVKVNTVLSQGDYLGLRIAYPMGSDGAKARSEAVVAISTNKLPGRLPEFFKSVSLE